MGNMEKLSIPLYLDEGFVKEYERLKEKYGPEIAKINGFSDEILSYTNFIDQFATKTTVADATVDGSANSHNRDIVSLRREMPKPHEKLLAFNKIYTGIRNKYGVDEANKWLEMEWNGTLYLHDANSSTFISYCFAYDLRDLAEKGLYFMKDRQAHPAKHLITFIDFIKEFVSFASNRTSGAVGLPNLVPYMYYFWREDIKNGYMGLTEKDGESYAKSNIQRFIYAINQSFIRDSAQSAFTNTSVFDHPYFEALFGDAVFPDGSYMIDDEEEIMQFQKWYMEEMSDIRSECMFTFPVSTISLLYKKGEFVDKEFAEWAIEHNRKWNDSNIFCDSSVNSLSNCCRLKSNIKDLGYFNSIGGTALKVGSVKVSTVNLARIALMSDNTAEYLDNLRKAVVVDLEALDVIRHVIKRNVEKGLLPNFSYGLIDFEHLYNTVGFIGVYETMKRFGFTHEDIFGNTFYDKNAELLGKNLFDVIHNTSDSFIEKYGLKYHINCEQIPGESAASKLMRKDKILYPDADIYDLPLYGNQFMPLGIKSTLQERIRVQALFDKFCSGGSIQHVNIDTPFDSFEKAWKMVHYIADAGVTYFAFNTKIQACKNNHAFYGKVCPVCGEPVETEYTRIVGFYTPIKTWSKDRKTEYKLRKWANPNNEI